jgi:hypothetical protein
MAPIYPIVDEQLFRIEVQKYHQSALADDPLWPLLLGIVLLLGSLHVETGENSTVNLEKWRRNEMLKIISSAHLLYMRSSIRSVQVLLLTVSQSSIRGTLTRTVYVLSIGKTV